MHLDAEVQGLPTCSTARHVLHLRFQRPAWLGPIRLTVAYAVPNHPRSDVRMNVSFLSPLEIAAAPPCGLEVSPRRCWLVQSIERSSHDPSLIRPRQPRIPDVSQKEQTKPYRIKEGQRAGRFEEGNTCLAQLSVSACLDRHMGVDPQPRS